MLNKSYDDDYCDVQIGKFGPWAINIHIDKRHFVVTRSFTMNHTRFIFSLFWRFLLCLLSGSLPWAQSVPVLLQTWGRLYLRQKQSKNKYGLGNCSVDTQPFSGHVTQVATERSYVIRVYQHPGRVAKDGRECVLLKVEVLYREKKEERKEKQEINSLPVPAKS